jgi:hypothetical protein
VYRDHRNDTAVDFSPVVVNFAKAIEVQANDVLRRATAGTPPAVRRVNVEGRSVDVSTAGPFSLGQLARIIGDSQEINALLKRTLAHGEWFTASLPPILRALSGARNPAAHTGRVSREDAARWRNQVVGVACAGTLVELGRVR